LIDVVDGLESVALRPHAYQADAVDAKPQSIATIHDQCLDLIARQRAFHLPITPPALQRNAVEAGTPTLRASPYLALADPPQRRRSGQAQRRWQPIHGPGGPPPMPSPSAKAGPRPCQTAVAAGFPPPRAMPTARQQPACRAPGSRPSPAITTVHVRDACTSPW